MRIIKPYGRSKTTAGKKRLITLKPEYKEGVDVFETLKDKPDFISAVWISAIDKIATKPDNNKKPTPAQRDFREKLGCSAWPLIESKLRVFLGKDMIDEFKKKWARKIHPYPKGEYSPPKNPPEPKGRLYKLFAGDIEIKLLKPDDYKRITEKIQLHLYVSSITEGSKTIIKSKGRIQANLQSIERNVLDDKTKKQGWSEQTTIDYKQKWEGDIAEQIKQKIAPMSRCTSREAFEQAVIILKEVYASVFSDGNNGVLSIRDASEKHTELFALHSAIKGTYRNLLKDSKAKMAPKKLRLPRNWNALLLLVNAKVDNREINAIIRLGRIIHYESGQEDIFEWITKHHSDHVLDNSIFWLSDGQAEIKRNEALVRIWRNVIAIGSQTLTDWAGHTNPNEVLAGDSIKQAIHEGNFCQNRYYKKLHVLFGERSDKISVDDASSIIILETALKGWSKLRNDSFHFKNTTDLVSTLTNVNDLKLNNNESIPESVKYLWDTDSHDRHNRLLSIMHSAHFKTYFVQRQAEQFVDAYIDAPIRTLPLPRFRRILDRGDKAKLSDVNLPAPHNQQEYQNNKWLHCQHTALKLIYERVFPSWLEKQSADNINSWIEQSVNHATIAARKINKDSENVIVSRADDLIKLRSTEKIDGFFQLLTANTATEMRVQRGYKSDPENARNQALYIGNLECDVIALGFCVFLAEKELTWLASKEGEISTEEYVIEPSALKMDIDNADDWMKILYFLIHLVPVEDVNHLNHQLLKNMCLQKDESNNCLIQKLLKILQLYMDMHDAQFVGDQPLHEGEFNGFKYLYENKELFEQIFPDTPSKQDEINKPSYRGLREMRRFGGQQALKKVFKKFPVREIHYKDWEKNAGSIEKDQERRKILHEKWAKSPRKIKPTERLSDVELEEYKQSLERIISYRNARHHLHLINHVRLHRLLMRILGRLADFSGLWERDLYFILLATFYRKKIQNFDDVINDKGRHRLNDGQVISAIDNLSSNDLGIKEEITKIFFMRDNSLSNETYIKIIRGFRNNFAHFNMIRQKDEESEIDLNLTNEVNKARQMMAYDRKLKNAVSKSIIEILQREGLNLEWEMDANHDLYNAVIRTRTIKHLGIEKLVEPLHNEDYVRMVAEVFGGKFAVPIKKYHNLPGRKHSRKKKKNT